MDQIELFELDHLTVCKNDWYLNELFVILETV